MSKLFGLKEWVTLEEAASHLAERLKETVTEVDILRFALHKRLTVSVHFVNPAYARRGKAVPLPVADDVVGIPFDGKDLLVFEDVVRSLTGVYDLPMIGAEIHDCQHRLQRLIGGPLVMMSDPRGAFVRSPTTGDYFQMMEYAQSEGNVAPPMKEFEKWSWSNRISDEVGWHYREEMGHKMQGAPSRDALFVVRQAALQAFVESLAPPLEDRPIGTRERDTLLTIIAALAKEAKIDLGTPSKAASLIEGMAAQLGAPVSKRAIEDHLKNIPAAVSARSR